MCGIVGVLKLDLGDWDFSEDVLMNMAATLRHRGPDAVGIQWDGACGLAHQRLSIIDLTDAGRQPMSNEDRTIWFSYNGEIYNFRELRQQFSLDQKGHRFYSRTDTEVILHLYEELGVDCVKQFNGMYAFALWDSRIQTLHLARDPFGIKPLFYMHYKGAFWFASEIKALLAVPGYTPNPSLEALYHFLSFNYIPGALTAFENIHELRPGHRLSICPVDQQIHITRFYNVEYHINEQLSEADAIEQSRELLTQAVERQLIADVPVGVMLSGGLDSSALTALMAKVRGDSDFHTFSISFDDSSFDESSYAWMVARHVGTKHHEVLVTPDKVKNLLSTYLSYIDEPYADGSAIPTYLLAECAQEHVKVLLSGEGGDEFFTGYDTHAAYKVRQVYRWIPPLLRQKMIRPCVEMLPVSHDKLSFDFKAKRFVHGAELDIPNSHFYWRMVLSEDAKKSVLCQLSQFTDFPPSAQLFVNAYNSCLAEDELNRLLYVDYSYHLPDDLMIKNDRMTMAHSLEARVPFTDTLLVNFLATVPVALKLKGMQKKHLLRSALDDLLPKAVLNKRKVGLEMPYSRWLITELRGIVETVLSPSKLNSTGLFNAKAITKIWEEHQSRSIDHGRFLWGLLNYMLWYEIYIHKISLFPIHKY
ncbi:asparagine synthase (glutamine-hydrolyzing) [Coleofasciculus sp.]|uniref:asparagine synthase (glutamine-hydrolyzing) n=1 Tax=Coleofasciculus sp. TaxID=3100458 RepID=UPI0039FA50AC